VTKLGELTEAYQVYVEGVRNDPDNEELYEDMLRAKTALEIAWLNELSEHS